MPFSYGFLLGLFVVIVGVIMLFITKNRKISLAVILVGTAISLFTLLVIILAATSQM